MKKNLLVTAATLAVVALTVGCGGGEAPAPSAAPTVESAPAAAPAGGDRKSVV